MQHAIGEHALLADSRTAALVDPDGNVAWLCWPWIDSTPLFFSILDDGRGGTFSLRPARSDARVMSRRYHSRSLVLETVWEVGSARLIVDEALDLGDGPRLVRSMRVEGEAVAVMIGITAPSWPGTVGVVQAHGHAVELEGVARVAVHAPAAWTSTANGATCDFIVEREMPVTVTLGDAGASAGAAIGSTLAEGRGASSRNTPP